MVSPAHQQFPSHSIDGDDVELGQTGLRFTQPDPTSYQSLYATLPLDVSHRETRVLDLRPSRNRNAPLLGSLRVVSLADSPHFTALSYVWGITTGGEESQIQLNSYSVGLTPNCSQALRQIRRNYGAVTIWVDSICIDQSNESEKSRQIPLMGEIYSWAQNVYIWLGDCDETSDVAMDWIWWNSHSKHCIEFTPLVSQFETLRERLAAQWAFVIALLPASIFHRFTTPTHAIIILSRYYLMFIAMSFKYTGSTADFDSAVLKLLSRPWFQRAWTFQELILAWNPVFLCGNKQVSWNAIVCGVDGLLRRPMVPVWRRDSWLSGLWAQLRPEKRTADQFALNRRGEAILSLLMIWMDLPRPMRWNGQVRRKMLFGGKEFASASDYQSLLRTNKDGGRGLRFWFYSTCLLHQVLIGLLLTFGTWGLPSITVALFNKFSGSGMVTDAAFGTWIALGSVAFGMGLIMIGHRLFMGRLSAHWLPGPIGDSREDVLRAFLRLFEQKSHDVDKKKLRHARSEIRKLYFEDMAMHCGETKQVNITLDGLILAIRERVATEAVDKARALHGILIQLGVINAPFDHDKSKSDVYTQLLGHLLTWQPAMLLMIMDAHSPPPMGSGRCSWVPDWSDIPTKGWLHRECFLRSTSIINMDEERRRMRTVLVSRCNSLSDIVPPDAPLSRLIDATKDSTAFAEVHGNEIVVRGASIDTIKWTARPIPSSLTCADFSDSAEPERRIIALQILEDLLQWMHLIRLESTYHPLSRAVSIVLQPHWRGKDYVATAEEQTRDQGFNTLYKFLSDSAVRLAGEQPQRLPESVEVLWGDISRDNEAKEFLVQVCNDMAGRRGLFFTCESRIGSATPRLEVGDKVYLICGVPVPMILRDTHQAPTRPAAETMHLVVGPSLVEGVMYGEAYVGDSMANVVLA